MTAARKILTSEYWTLLLCAAYFVAMAPFTPGFATGGNLANVFSAMLPLLVVATGQTVVLITAGIDLSVTSIIALASVTGALLISGDQGLLAGHAAAVPVGVLVMVALGGAIGLLNGTVITQLRMPPFVVTLTGMMFFSGFAIWLTEAKSIAALPSGFLALGKNPWLAGAIAAAVAAAGHLLLSRTLLGRWLYAIGHNPKVALVSGVPVNRALILAYVWCGLCAGLAAVLITARLESGSPVHWRSNLLDIIGATVIGGTSLYGGRGKVLWTVFGVLFLTLLDNSLNLLNLSHFTIMMVKGVVILFAAAMDVGRSSWLVVRGP